MGPTLADILQHLQTFWDRRQEPNIALFHYSDLLADLAGQLRRLSATLSIDVTDQQIDEFTTAGSFAAMRQRADDLVPDGGNPIWLSNREFFHRGTSGQWRDLLDEPGLLRYADRVAEVAAPDLALWAHNGWRGADSSR
jgi:hypothetical protein